MIRLWACWIAGLALLATLMAEAWAQTPRSATSALVQTECYLRIRNRTGEKLTVHVLYRSAGKGTPRWLPGAPENTARALTLVVEPNESAFLVDGGSVVPASRVRIWAQSPSGLWTRYMKQDLVLVPQPYKGSEVGIYTYQFSK
jgi:hypothetical protein